MRLKKKKTRTEIAPGLPILRIELQDGLEVLNGFGELLARAQNLRDGTHGRDRPLVMS